MSLTNALNAAITSLGVVQEGITVSSNNIANVDTPGYVKQTVLQGPIISGGVGQGVEILGISADVDAQLLKSMRDQTSDFGKSIVLDTYLDSAQRLLGQPGSNNSLSTEIDNFFTAFHNLSMNPETSSLKLAALNDAKDLVAKITSISRGLHQLRLDADRQIATDISQINNYINQLFNSNSEIIGFAEGTTGRLAVEQSRDLNLRKLSEYIDISTTVDSDGTLSILTKGGAALLDTTGKYKLAYTQAASIDNFINETSLSAITASAVEGDGSISPIATNLSTSGKSATVTTTLTSGNLKGLLEIRDTELPKIIEQLDTLADALRDEINAAHNDGSSFPPLSSFTGTKSVKSTDEFGFSGKVMIAVVDSDGTPPSSPYSDETNYRPLTLDFSKLNGGNGAGRPTMQTIVDEINDYYGPVQNRAVVGNLRDIKLAVFPDTDSIADAGTVKFDLQLDNISTEDATVVIDSVTVIDPTDASTGYNAATLPATNTYVVNPGDRERTGNSFTVDFGGDDNRASYTVRVRVRVTDETGNVSVADVDYTVSDNVTGVRNDKYAAQAVTNVSGTSTFHVAPTAQSYAQATIVNASNVVVAAGESGFLKIATTSGQNFGIAIDELDSSETGLPSSAASSITNRGFSHFFELNNLFVTNNDVVAESAINMAVRADIASNASYISTGKLVLSNQPDSSTSALYTYELGSGNNKVATSIAELDKKDISFTSAGTLPAITTTFSSYSGNVTGFVSTTALSMSDNRASEEVGMNGLRDLFQKSAGVNTDDELARIIELENNFRASAKILSIVQELFRVLNDTF